MNPVSKGSTRPSRKLRRLRQLGIALVLGTSALDANAAGLGRLNLMSGIGQPLRAEIEVTALNKDEIGSLNARLASPAAFGQAGIEYGSALSGLRFSVQRRAGGQAYVLVTSSALVNDPYLDLLVELSWNSGRLVREYTMLLDPPETRAARTEIEPGQTIVQARSAAAAAAAAAVSAPRAASPATGGGATPSAAAQSTTAPASATPPASSGNDYVVQDGDTAMSIARANKVDNVSLEQMLAALYRDNPRAFGGNINRLMAGATVKLPDATSAQSVDGPQARRIIAQSGNFGRYRERIAENATTATPSRASGQQATGRLTPQVQDNGAAGTDARDRLQLSRPDGTRAAAAAAPPTGARTGAAGPTSEELAAKDRELTESRSRLAQLEKNVADLQQLLKLKNQTLADLQKATDKPAGQAAAPVASAPVMTPPPPPTPVPPTVTPPAPVAVAPAPTAPAAILATAEPAPSAAAPVPPAAAPAPLPVITPPVVSAPTPSAPAPTKAAPPVIPAPDTDGSWYDALLDNSLLLAGLVVLVVLLLGYGIVTALRRRKLAGFEDSIFVDNSVLHANSVFGTTGGQSVDTANSAFHSNFVPVAGSLPDQSEVDPVAEADVYIAYGRDAQAEEILKEALRGDGKRHAVRHKLLEIYARRGDVKSFETTASELYAMTGGEGDDWKQAATLGASIDPRNPLYSETAASTPPASMVAAMPASMAASMPAAMAAPAPASLAGSPSGTMAGPMASPPPNAARGAALAAAQGAFMMSEVGDGMSGAPAGPGPIDHTRTDPLPRPSPGTEAAPPSMDLDFDLGFGSAAVPPLQAAGASDAPAPAAAPSPVDNTFDFDTSESSKPLIDPFTASAFGGSDASVRTAVNLPAFRARADQPSADDRPGASRVDDEGFSASDIFGSSIIADTEPYSETPPETPPEIPAEPSLDVPPATVRASEYRHKLDAQDHAFDKTEPLDAFNKINLDLDTDDFAAPAGSSASGTTDFGARTEVWQAMATKLDLALAYSDIGDKDGARELLEEVVRSGDETQSDRARTLIGQLD